MTIAIPTFNRAASLEATLRSLSTVSIPDGWSCQVLVVDNASTDDTPRISREASHRFLFPVRHVIEGQQGLCFSRNRALSETDDEYVVFFDDDVEVSKGWLLGYAEAVERMSADCVVGIVRPSYRAPLPPYATPYVTGLIGSPYSQKGDRYLKLPIELCSEIPGCNFGVRREAALSIGGFSNSLDRVGKGLLAGGDSEFGIRLAKAGRSIIYSPDCTVTHVIGPDKMTRSHLRRRAAGLGRTSSRIRSMHGPARLSAYWYKGFKRSVGLWLRWQGRMASGRAVEAFEWELRTRRHVAEVASALWPGPRDR